VAGDTARVIAHLNAISESAFVAEMAPLFEGAPRFLGRLAAARPFDTIDDLFDSARGIALSMPEPEQIELINAHPRLGAAPASVSAASFREQGYDHDTETAAADLARLNDEYERRFGFRFCVWVNRRSRAELVPVIEAALDAPRSAEIERALGDVVEIARDRFLGRADAGSEGAA
jgi:OHCU decarboxylase